jgi:hypothetical protein
MAVRKVKCVTYTNTGAQECVKGKRENAREGYSDRYGAEKLQSQCEMGDRIHYARVLLTG